jgi:predicted nucleic acid-binding protein
LILYFDTSVLVAALTAEANTAQIQAWLVKQDQAALAISDWTVTEFSSALSLKLRSGKISLQERAKALAGFTQLTLNTLRKFSVSPENFHTAAGFADQYELGLRSGDAVHLAVCAANSAAICTLDKHILNAGTILGIPTLLP